MPNKYAHQQPHGEAGGESPSNKCKEILCEGKFLLNNQKHSRAWPRGLETNFAYFKLFLLIFRDSSESNFPCIYLPKHRQDKGRIPVSYSYPVVCQLDVPWMFFAWVNACATEKSEWVDYEWEKSAPILSSLWQSTLLNCSLLPFSVRCSNSPKFVPFTTWFH